MFERFLLLSLICAAGMSFAIAKPEQDTASKIIALERSALDRWIKGDPDGFLEISDENVVYFDPFVERRLNNREELKAVYDKVRGTFRIDSYEMVDPKVRVSGDMAVLTFNFVPKGEDMRWNTTEVYQRIGGEWRIVHTHWSLTQPKLANTAE